MPYIIGTAGHIDHGKTSLIKALTGQDTDRLKEEKERGISIDLGFAYLDLPDGTRAGIVDVPGHERFIRNMLAGAHGIDLVLFTVAADDGVMPQTEEHLDILHLLGIKLAIFLITKADLATVSRMSEVEEEIRILTFETALENSPILPFSSVTNQGLPELKAKIWETLRACEKPQPAGYFRLPVDRAFVLQGHGLVVTGTGLSGEIGVGDKVRCLPGDEVFRVRSVQVHNRSVESAGWGQRVALNLSGQEKETIARGDVICHEELALTSDRFDAVLEVRPAAKNGIKNHQRVRIHLGTAERLAKLILLGAKEKVQPKESAYCQVTLAEPLLVMRGDRFIVRDETAQRTLGGGVVVHPWAKRHKRHEAGLEERLQALHTEDIPTLLERFLEEHDGFAAPIEPIYQFLNLKKEESQKWLERSKTALSFNAEGEKVYATERKWLGLKEKIIQTLRDFHGSHPLAPGMDMEELRGKLPYDMQPRLFRGLIDVLTSEQALSREGSLLRVADHKIQLRVEEKSLVDKIMRILSENPLSPPDLKQIEKDLGIVKARLNEVVRVMEREKSIVRIATDLYFAADCVDKVKELLYKYLSENKEITAATFRDLLGSSRKYTIPLLEYLDREGVTIRTGDARRLKAAK